MNVWNYLKNLCYCQKTDCLKNQNFLKKLNNLKCLKNCNNFKSRVIDRDLSFAGWVVITTALVWWCVLYPELCFPNDTYDTYEAVQAAERQSDESGTYRVKAYDTSETYPEILKAEDEQIIIGSRLLEWFTNRRD